MTKHSKNNTASSVFSYAEYKKLDYGTKKQRLGNESMRRFDCCALCLQRAREPLACTEGHLFCKECVYTDLLTQKKDIKRQKQRLEALKKEHQEEQERARAAARERVLQEFEKGQLGLGPSATSTTNGADTQDGRGTKRKFDFDSSLVDSLAREAEEAALRQIEKEQAEALKSKLPDFWLPSLTPTYSSSGPPRTLKEVKVQTTCRGGNPAHVLNMKDLIPVSFTKLPVGPSTSDATGDAAKSSSSKTDEEDSICTTCKKILSNSMVMYVMKPCSHVTCKTCTDSLARDSGQCLVCDKEVPKDGFIELCREGTGYAAGGMAETSRKGIAFQG